MKRGNFARPLLADVAAESHGGSSTPEDLAMLPELARFYAIPTTTALMSSSYFTPIAHPRYPDVMHRGGTNGRAATLQRVGGY